MNVVKVFARGRPEDLNDLVQLVHVVGALEEDEEEIREGMGIGLGTEAEDEGEGCG